MGPGIGRKDEVDRRDFIATLLAVAGSGALHAAEPATLLVVGDSLSAEYGLRRGTGWVALLEKRLAEQKLPVKVVNASISGDTSSGGRSRLGALLSQHKPTHVAIELGANDALRGLPIAMTEDNLSKMTEAAQAAGAKVLLVGIQLPPNYGSAYGEKFAALYDQVARRHKAALVPFLLKGVADVPNAERLFQADRIHPTEQAQPTLLDNVWPELRKLLAADTAGPAKARERKP
jgi:acyl-CoA thioesterase-1